MISLTKFFKTSSIQIQDITEDILGIRVPINAPSIAKVAAAQIVSKRMKEFFVKEYMIVLSDAKNIDQIKEILKKNNIKFEIGNFFKSKWECFNEESISICLEEDIPFEKRKKIALEIVETFKQKVMLKNHDSIFLVFSSDFENEKDKKHHIMKKKKKEVQVITINGNFPSFFW